MTWGSASWGAGSPWGTGTVLPPPTAVVVTSNVDPTTPTTPAVVAIRGGTVCRLFGTNIFDPVTVEISLNIGGFTVIAEGFVFDPEFDVARNHVWFGAPRLDRGLYSIRIVTAGGPSNVLVDAIIARPLADEFKTVSVRAKFSPKWRTGPRLLRRQ